MNTFSRYLFLSGVLLLVLVYFFPIWEIGLVAPQYPEGLVLEIWVDKISGHNPNDLSNVNILNHYIGMAPIEPESIPELKFMPYILAGIFVLGAFGFILNKKSLLLIWIILFALTGIIGMADFYMWEYNYGHNIDPHAPLKFPDVTYQPPFIGTKVMLNIHASSFPGFGGIILFTSMLLGFGALYVARKTPQSSGSLKIENNEDY